MKRGHQENIPLVIGVFLAVIAVGFSTNGCKSGCAKNADNAGTGVTAGVTAEDAPKTKIFHVGYQVLDFKYQSEGREKTLTVAVWYPTEAQPKTYN